MTARAVTAGLALVAAGAFAVTAVVLGLDQSSPAGFAHGASWLIPAVPAVAGFGLLAMALRFAFAPPIALAVGLLGAAFLLGLPSAGSWRATAPFAAVWLLTVAELSTWSLDLKVRGSDGPTVYGRRIGAIAGLVALGLVLGTTALAGLDPIGFGGLELTALGLLGGLTLVGIAAALAWRLRSEPDAEWDLPGVAPDR